ncbi:uncharacterized protein LOC129742365 [Uranotaenia lowii]|uniref:uncharacterized protein LOC129742365 n=1 Tax=Uranotaenia lowii TaxID=190385 RepID=UPI00247AC42B|nr:uncharacterized protein LOC129742365 [Uranotaenia lowii]
MKRNHFNGDRDDLGQLPTYGNLLYLSSREFRICGNPSSVNRIAHPSFGHSPFEHSLARLPPDSSRRADASSQVTKWCIVSLNPRPGRNPKVNRIILPRSAPAATIGDPARFFPFSTGKQILIVSAPALPRCRPSLVEGGDDQSIAGSSLYPDYGNQNQNPRYALLGMQTRMFRANKEHPFDDDDDGLGDVGDNGEKQSAASDQIGDCTLAPVVCWRCTAIDNRTSRKNSVANCRKTTVRGKFSQISILR